MTAAFFGDFLFGRVVEKVIFILFYFFVFGYRLFFFFLLLVLFLNFILYFFKFLGKGAG